MCRIILILLSFLIIVHNASADIHTVGSCENKTGKLDVQNSIDAADNGDTVQLPAGTCIWDVGITINKQIILAGASKETTIIKASAAITMITFAPGSNIGIEIRDINIDQNNQAAMGVLIQPSPARAYIDNVKIHDIVFTNCDKCLYLIDAVINGVFYKNTVTTRGDGSARYTLMQCVGNNQNSWDNITASHDNGGGMYFEDNTFTISDAIIDGAAGCRWVTRYNTINVIATNAVTPIWDGHGNSPSMHGTGHCGTIEQAIYGNQITDSSNKVGLIYGQRGGMALGYYNYIAGNNNYWNSYDEYSDSDVNSVCESENIEVQHPSTSYFWTNQGTSSQYASHTITKCCLGSGADPVTETYPVENTDIFVQRPGTFDGSGESIAHGDAFDKGGGVGCGTLANRPATCTTGVGYWATNQRCDNLDGMVGASPSTPISGTLYKCNTDSEWEPYYTPYTYPHPLRNIHAKLTLGTGATATVNAGATISLQ